MMPATAASTLLPINIHTSGASNGLDACLPLWMREGGKDKMIARLKDPLQRERAKKEMDDPQAKGWENQWYGSGGSDGVMLSSVLNGDLKKYEGKTLTEIGRIDEQRPARCGHGSCHRRSSGKVQS
ncbi:MAG: hypothetical protein IPG76_24020 [Acidobacteria bacterium]|nr:hypothetical protein [Acidobacteriota bacterium]